MRKFRFEDGLVLFAIIIAIFLALGLSSIVLPNVINFGINIDNFKWLLLVIAFWFIIAKLTILLIRGK